MVMTADMNDPPITAMFALAYLNVVFQKCKHTLAMQVDPLQGHSCAIQYATNGLRNQLQSLRSVRTRCYASHLQYCRQLALIGQDILALQ